MARARPKHEGLAQGLTLVTLAAPFLLLIAAFGTSLGLWDASVGYDRLALQVAWWLAFVGVVAALAAAVLARRDLKRLGLYVIVALVVSVGTLGAIAWQKARLAEGLPEDVSTNPDDRPGFSEAVAAARGEGGPASAIGPEACPAAQPVMRQVAPQRAYEALQAAGFTARGAFAARADGDRTGFWFGFTHDAVVRIRPGRTDIRVAARDGRSHGGEACRLAGEISRALQTAE
ncbi:DUF1499 domain-containing protein [Nostoc sp. CHAB 5834]|nr:DUF1499 domain-containing protein [Nostoc sp. CHAB 5834]